MKRIDKNACRNFLEPTAAPNPDSGLFLLSKIKYVIRTVVKIVSHRRLLILCLYAKGDVPGDEPKLTYTMFQASDSFITYDHRPDTKTLWRTAMLDNLERDYYFPDKTCVFYSKQDAARAINFCRPYVPERCLENGFNALTKMQTQIRDRETLNRQKNRERKTRSRFCDLRPLPRDLERWLRREALPAYFFYDYQKGKKSTKGICSACGQEVELQSVRHNATGVCPCCGRQFTMKSNKKRGYLWDHVTASVVQKFGDDQMIVRVVKAYLTWPKDGPEVLDVHEKIREVIGKNENGEFIKDVSHYSHNSVGITPWKKGYPPMPYMSYGFASETCGFLYCKNLDRELRGTPWQYCQLKEFYHGIQDQMEVAPYLISYRKIPAIEFLVKLKMFWLAVHVVYERDGEKVVNPQGKGLRGVLQIEPSDLPWLQRPKAGIRDLQLLRILRLAGHQPSSEFFDWLDAYDIKEPDRLERVLRYTTPHKLMRYLDARLSKPEPHDRYGRNAVLSDYDDYLRFCEQLQYDLKNEFVLFPKNLKQAHDQAHNLIKQHQVERFDAQIASMEEDLKRRYQFSSEELVVQPPHSAQEIVVEGQKLHHCVGSYAERMAKQQCVILFIRQKEKQDVPFYTVEVNGKRIVQVRGTHNCAPIPEVKDFLEKWKTKKHLDEAA